MRGTSQAFEDYIIDGNRFQGLSNGIQLDTLTNGIRATECNLFRNVATMIVDNGANNVTQCGGRLYAVAGVPTNVNLADTRLVVYDATSSTPGARATGGGAGVFPSFMTARRGRYG